MLVALEEWTAWKQEEFEKGNSKVQLITTQDPNGQTHQYYKYYGNMMSWPGWKLLPPVTWLMIETGKRKKNKTVSYF